MADAAVLDVEQAEHTLAKDAQTASRVDGARTLST